MSNTSEQKSNDFSEQGDAVNVSRINEFQVGFNPALLGDVADDTTV